GKFGEARGEGTIHITLRAPQPPPPGDVWGAFAILQEGWQQSQDTKYYARTHLPLAIAPYDPDLALQMATDPYGHVPDSVLSGTIAALAGYDPMRAVLWAPPQLARITDAQARQNARLQLGLSIAEIAPDIAAQLYQQAERHWRARAGFNSPGRQIYDFIGLGRLAATLQRDDARQWFDRAFASAEQLPGNERAGLMRVTLEAMAPYFPQQTEKLAPQLPEEGNASAGWTLSQVVRALAPVDLAAAQRLLKTLRE